MSDALALAAAYGVRVEAADLGDWRPARMIAEYDPDGPVIRVHSALRQAQDDLRQAQDALRQAQDDAVELAIAHELYHHREAIGEVPRIADRRAREAAADAFAASLAGACDLRERD